MPRNTPEGRVKDDIKAYLTQLGAYQYWPVPMGFGAATIDCLACYKGWFIGIEVKRPDTRPKPTRRQLTILDEIASSNGATVVAYGVEDVQNRIKALERTYNGRM